MPGFARLSLALSLCVGLSPVWAPACFAQPAGGASTQAVRPAPKPADGPLRDFSLRNQSSQTIVEAHASTTGQSDELITGRGAITTNHAQAFKVKADQCVGAVTVKFKDGRTLRADLNDCSTPMIEVRDDGIQAASSAVPGTQVTPGEGPRGQKEIR